MKDYRVGGRQAASAKHKEALREVAIKRVEAGHRRVRAYAVAWGKISAQVVGASRMSCYRVLKSEGLIQPKRIGYDLRQAAEQRRQRLKAPENTNEVLQGDFTDYVTEDGEKYRIGGVTEYLSRFNLVSEVLDTETALDLIAVVEAALREIAELGHASRTDDFGDRQWAGDEVSTVQKLCEEDGTVDPCAITEVSSADHWTRGTLSWVAQTGAFVSSVTEQSHRADRRG